MHVQSATPADIFQQSLRAMQSGDVESYLALCTDDVVFEFPFAPPGRPARVEGREALGRYLAATAILSRIEALALSNLEFHQTVNPDVAIAEMTIAGKVKGTGEPYARSYVGVLTVREGRIARYRDYWNPLESLSAAQEG